MRINLQLTALFSLQLLNVAAQRRGGGGGDSDGDSGDDDSGSSGGGGNIIESPEVLPNGLTDSYYCGLGKCLCQQVPEREMLFGLPGVYYNGTLTIRHQISESTVWNSGGSGACGNDDGSVKTYEYPALFVAAVRGNESDTNPFHWALYGFQPGDQGTIGADGPLIDVSQRWILIKSSDFVVSGTSYGGSFEYPGSKALYSNSDSTDKHQNTRVYWPTEITDFSDNRFSARATYSEVPPLGFEGISEQPDVRNSQFFTLSDVCAYNQTTNLDTVPPPKSLIPKDNDYSNTTTPTIWLEEGTVAEMEGIGADEMTFLINATLSSATAYIVDRKPQCAKEQGVAYNAGYIDQPLEQAAFWGLNTVGDYDAQWQLGLTVSLSFQGSIVSENSTRITGRDGADVTFEAGYETPAPPEETQSPENAAVSGRQLGSAIWMIGLFTITMMV